MSRLIVHCMLGWRNEHAATGRSKCFKQSNTLYWQIPWSMANEFWELIVRHFETRWRHLSRRTNYLLMNILVVWCEFMYGIHFPLHHGLFWNSSYPLYMRFSGLWYQIMLDKQELSRSRSRRSPINCCVSFSFKHSTEAIRNKFTTSNDACIWHDCIKWTTISCGRSQIR